MKKRVISVIVFLSIAAALLLIDCTTRMLFVLICGCICCHDMTNALNKLGHRATPIFGYLFVLANCLLIYLDSLDLLEASDLHFPILLILIFAALSVSIFTEKYNPTDMLLSLALLIYPGMLFLMITQVLAAPAPLWYMGIVCGAASAALCDTFALFGGMAFGKHKLAPRISPKKTIEGSVCGLISAVVTGVILFFIFKKTGIVIPVWGYMAISAVSSTLGQMGDLIASSFKRQAGIKDYSNLIPGHGGMMDRLDSHLFAIPVAYYMIQLFLSLPVK